MNSQKFDKFAIIEHKSCLKARLEVKSVTKLDKEIHKRSLELLEWLEEQKNAGRKKSIDDDEIRLLQKAGKTQEDIMKELNISLSSVRRAWVKSPKRKEKIFTLEVDGEKRKYFKRKLDVQKERETLENKENKVYSIEKDLEGYFLKEVIKNG